MTPPTPNCDPAATPSTPSHNSIQRVTLELSILQSQYDELLRVHRRAEARYEADYRKWREFKEWLFDEETQNKKNRNGKGTELNNVMSKEARKKRANARIWKKRQMLLKIGPNLTALRDGAAFDEGMFFRLLRVLTITELTML